MSGWPVHTEPSKGICWLHGDTEPNLVPDLSPGMVLLIAQDGVSEPILKGG